MKNKVIIILVAIFALALVAGEVFSQTNLQVMMFTGNYNLCN